MLRRPEPIRARVHGEMTTVPNIPDSPTVLPNEAWESVENLAHQTLHAYSSYCLSHNLPINQRVALDIAMSGRLQRQKGQTVVGDIRFVLLEGPCCNGVPNCMLFWPSKTSENWSARSSQEVTDLRTDRVLIARLKQLAGQEGTLALLTGNDQETHEPKAHQELIAIAQQEGLEIFHICGERPPQVQDGHIWVQGHSIDLVYRCIERQEFPRLFGHELTHKMLHETPKTVWFNPPSTDDMRSKTMAEIVWREWESTTNQRISRPQTLIGHEITVEHINQFWMNGGFLVKANDTSGGKGVRFVMNPETLQPVADSLYKGLHPTQQESLQPEKLTAYIESLDKQNCIVQELRILDARPAGQANLIYDIRMYGLYQGHEKAWTLIPGMSRFNQHCLSTNISQKAGVTALLCPRHTKNLPLTPLGLLTETWLAKREYWLPSP